MSTPRLYDVTLRDGNHALRHQVSLDFVRAYCTAADSAGLWAVEVGHGNGLGASSHLVGRSMHSDMELLSAARESLSHAKLAVHSIPGFATLNRDLKPAIAEGVEIFRVATHATEASIAAPHISFLAERGLEAHGVLMMSHTLTVADLVDQCRQMVSFGATAVILMDSAGNFVPGDVSSRIEAIKGELSVSIGLHAHNNLGLGVANALRAADSGASIIDGAAMGLGAGSGNAQLECVAAVLWDDAIDSTRLSSILGLSQLTETWHNEFLPRTNATSVLSGTAGVFSGYAPQVKTAAAELGLDEERLWREVGRRQLVPGQESMIHEIALDLMNL